MLFVYDSGQKFSVTNATEFYIDHVDGGIDTLNFSIPVDDPIYAHLAEENRMEYGDNDYNIKSIDAPGSSANIKCEINLDFLKANFHKVYDSGSLTLSALLQTLLPTGWTIIGYNPGISRTISMENATDYDVMKQAIKTYSVAFQWHTLTKMVVVINPNDKTSSGEYLTDELNLRSIAFKGESTAFITRLYPYGKEGLTIATVNNGVEYVENHQYSDKIICGSWSDERYTVPDDLKTDAIKKLASLSVPARSYDCDVIDLAKLEDKYSDFSFAMYKVVTLIDRKRKIRLDHQIMEYKEYPEQPEKNVLTLSSVVATVQDNVNQAQLTAETAQASADAAAQEVKLANIKIGNLAIDVKATADGLESKVSKDDLGSDIQQHPEDILLAFNSADGSKSIKITGDGFDFYNGTTYIGHMGVKDDSLDFTLADGKTMQWHSERGDYSMSWHPFDEDGGMEGGFHAGNIYPSYVNMKGGNIMKVGRLQADSIFNDSDEIRIGGHVFMPTHFTDKDGNSYIGLLESA